MEDISLEIQKESLKSITLKKTLKAQPMATEPKSPLGKNLVKNGWPADCAQVQLADAYWQLRILWQKKLGARTEEAADDAESDMTDVVMKIQQLETQLQ